MKRDDRYFTFPCASYLTFPTAEEASKLSVVKLGGRVRQCDECGHWHVDIPVYPHSAESTNTKQRKSKWPPGYTPTADDVARVERMIAEQREQLNAPRRKP